MKSSDNILAADVGGTKTLIAVYSFRDTLMQLYKKKYYSKQWGSLEEITRDFLKSLPESITKPNSGCIGIAGRISKESIKATNLSWNINREEFIRSSGLKSIELINDFEVLVHGLPFLKKSQTIDIQSIQESSHNNSISTIIGAGTGLGIASGINTTNGFFSLPSEGGHMEFSARNDAEWELIKWLKFELGTNRISIERIVSGTGLGFIAKWILHKNNVSHPLKDIAKTWNTKANHPDLPALTSELANRGDHLMEEALNMWLSAYGSAAGDIALQELCTGGLWLSGGTAQKQISGLKSETFLNSFHNKGRFKSFLQEIPVRAIVDSEVGLFSAACKARINAEKNEKLT